MSISQSEVVAAAAELIDERGLDALTLRVVADRVGVSAPTLYWHVQSKRHLLDLVAEQIVADAHASDDGAPARGESLPDWLARRSRAQRAALLAHRDSARIVAGNRPTPNSLPMIERMLAACADAGLQPGEALRTVLALGAYILGDVLETQSEAQRPGDEQQTVPDEGYPLMTSAAYPLMTSAALGMGDDDDRFEHGLSLLLDGLRQRLSERAPA